MDLVVYYVRVRVRVRLGLAGVLAHEIVGYLVREQFGRRRRSLVVDSDREGCLDGSCCSSLLVVCRLHGLWYSSLTSRDGCHDDHPTFRW